MRRYQLGPPRIEDELEHLELNEERLIGLLRILVRNSEIIMSELDDLNAAVDKMSKAVDDAVADIKKLADEIAASSSNPAAVEAAAQKLNTLADNLEAAAQT